MGQRDISPPDSGNAGAGCLIVFGLPFFLIGAFLAEQAIFGTVQKSSDRLPMACGGLLFAAVGAAIIMGGIWAVRSARRTRALRDAQPDQPWLWNSDWAAGAIPDSAGVGAIALWVFALLWNGLSWPITILAMREARRDPKVFLVLIFPAVGLAILWGAIYQTLRRMKFGRSVLELETLPGCVGGWLAGTIQTAAPLAPESLHLSLRCIRRTTTGSGKQRHTSESVLWEAEQSLTGKLDLGKHGGNAIPVSFQIPARCRPTEQIASRDEILWRLRAHAAVPGADYAADFLVPVFDAADRMQPQGFVPRAEAPAARLRAPTPARSRRGDDPRIRFTIGPGMRKRFVFPAGRNRGSAITLTIFALVLGGAGYLAQAVHGPWFIGVLCGAVGGLFGWGALVSWFREIELTIDSHGVQYQWRMLGMGGVRSIDAGDISSIAFHSNTTVNNVKYYKIEAKLKENGGEQKLISGLRQRDAQWIAGEIAQSLNVVSTEDSEPAGIDPS
jgi:hypothetical protein